MDDATLASIRAQLEQEKVELEHQLAEHGAQAGQDELHVDVDSGFADSPQVTAERAELLGIVEQLRARHAERIAALASIAAGTYGTCERCGSEIPPERLEAMPAALLCVGCKQEAR